MKKMSIALMVLLCTMSMGSYAQFGFVNKIKLLSGDLKFLKGSTELNITFNYDEMKVGEMQEADYVVKHSAEMNKAKPGSGDEWKKKWVDDRGLKFQPAFIKMFNARLKKLKMVAGTDKSSAKYTVIIKTEKTEPGLYTGISYAEKDAFIDVRATFVETTNPGTELCVIYGTYIKGAETFDVGARITYSYTNWGSILGGFIVGQIKKMK